MANTPAASEVAYEAASANGVQSVAFIFVKDWEDKRGVRRGCCTCSHPFNRPRPTAARESLVQLRFRVYPVPRKEIKRLSKTHSGYLPREIACKSGGLCRLAGVALLLVLS